MHLLACCRRISAVGLAGFALLGIVGTEEAATGVGTAAQEVSASVSGTKTFRLPNKATHIAVHWRGNHDARVIVAFSRDGRHFGPPAAVELDEVGEQRGNGETYGAVIVAREVRAVRVWSDRHLARLSVLSLTDRGSPTRSLSGRTVSAQIAQPAVITRAGWGADESLRFDATGKEIWPPAFWPIQKLIVHHTATTNGDPNPAATIRSIYYYHAVTQGWGDIGYNFVVDEAGSIYEGRFSRQYAAGESPTGEDPNGNGVTAAHASGFNSGTVGVALLGTLTSRDATAQARDALERMLAWKADRHGIDPQGASLYTNPVNGTQKTFANIAGHRDVNATQCPGGTFYDTLPTIRANVAARLAAGPDFTLAASPSSATTSQDGSVTYTVSVGSQNGFFSSVELSVTGVPAGAMASLTPSSVAAPGSSQLTVTTSISTTPGSYSLSISGTSGSLVHTTSVTLVVNPPPDFGLSISPTSRTVRQGRSTSYAVDVSSRGGFAGTVILSVSGLPAGATAIFNPGSVVAPGSSTLTVKTVVSTPRGTFTLTVTGTSGSIVHTAVASLTVKR